MKTPRPPRGLPVTDDEPRDCGACSACCNVFHIEDLTEASPRWEDCHHLTARGCGIYHRRPECCRVYRCAWLDGWGEEEDRPDLLGVVLDWNEERPRIGVTAWWLAMEVEPGSGRRGRAARVLRRLRRERMVKLVHHGAMGMENFGEELPPPE